MTDLVKSTGTRRRTIIYWLVSLPILLETTAGIQWDFSRNETVRQIFDHLQFPYYFLYVLGAAKVLALIAFIVPGFPRLKEWAYAGLFFVYVGAAALHFSRQHPGEGIWGQGLIPILLAVVTLASWALRPPSRRDPAPLPEIWSRTVARP